MDSFGHGLTRHRKTSEGRTMTEILEAMTRPDVNGTPSLPKRTGPKGLLLAINPASVSHISSVWSKQLGQNILRIHLNNGRAVQVFESDAADTLEALGLEVFV